MRAAAARALAQLALDRLGRIECRKADAAEEAGIWMLSLPWPNVAARPISLGGQPTHAAPLGQWPGQTAAAPRRLLLAADAADNKAPDVLRLSAEAAAARAAVPTLTAEQFAASTEEGFPWERHLLRVAHGLRSLGLALGLRTGGEVHWWEACRLVVLDRSPFCVTARMGGAIPVRQPTRELLLSRDGYNVPLLHQHNWLYGDLFVRAYANGVCEVFVRHTNNRFVDEGAPLHDVVPVIGLLHAGAVPAGLLGDFDGSRTALDLDGVRLDLRETARLATQEKPGRFDRADPFLVYQPFLAAELFGGRCPAERAGDPWILKAQDRTILRGMTRTLRFSFSLSDRSPQIARYLPPYWWYGQMREITAWSYLPVSNVFDARLEQSREWIGRMIHRGGFEDGAVPRHPTKPPVDGRHEPGWEGEVPYAQFLLAYRSGGADDYHHALRSAYHVTDLVVNHASKVMRMHGYAPEAYALPMTRVLGSIAAYLETGDPYLLETAEAATEAAYRLHLNSWPRRAIGRDAMFARGAVMLYRYFNNNHFRRIGCEVARMVAESQRDDGSFGDQGGGAGMHAVGAYITKPWMGCMAVACVLDCLELLPGEPRLCECVRRFGDWLMQVRWTRDGFTGWSYQHRFDGQPRYFDLSTGTWADVPGRGQWHHDSLARVLGFCTLHSGDPRYLEAFMESYRHLAQPNQGDHAVSAAAQFLPWLQTLLWRAELRDAGVTLHPLPGGPLVPAAAQVFTPDGPQTVSRPAAGVLRRAAEEALQRIAVHRARASSPAAGTPRGTVPQPSAEKRRSHDRRNEHGNCPSLE